MMCTRRCALLVTFILPFLGLVCLSGGQDVTSPSGCQVLRSSLCADHVNYTRTQYPNFIGHQNHEDANLELTYFSSFIQYECSPYIGQFVCGVYHPYCDSDGVRFLCRSACELVYEDCIALVNWYGAEWPENLNCTSFPQHECIEFNTEETTTVASDITTAAVTRAETAQSASVKLSPTTFTPATTPNAGVVETTPGAPASCELLTSETCLSYLPYNQTTYPNYFFDSDQASAENTLGEMALVMQVRCSEYLPLFLCSVVHPKCGVDGMVPPCRSVCQSAYDGCNSMLTQINVEWPPFLSCSNFPSSEDGDVCVGPPGPGEDGGGGSTQCEAVTVEMCRDFYDGTRLPNMVGHQNQSEVSSALESFEPFIAIGCSEYFSLLVCAMYLPKCDDSGVILPCQSLCEHVRDDCKPVLDGFGLPWPMDCEITLLFSPDSSPNCVSEDHAPPPGDLCEPVSVAMCQDLYNGTSLPNTIGHQTQSEVASALESFQAFVGLGCSDHFQLLVCSLYLPKCGDRGVVPPCQSLCERVRDDCQAMLGAMGIEWPIDCQMTFLFSTGSHPECVSVEDVPTTVQPISTTTLHPGCPDPGDLTNGDVDTVGGFSNFPAIVGSQITFSCDPNYSLIGTPVSSCRSDSTWSLPLPQCIADCSDPGSPAHGSQTGTPSYRAYTTVSFDCDRGFTLAGAHIVTCNNGAWSHPVPVCTVFCEAIHIPQCQGLPYSLTGFPNFAGHSSQSEAEIFLALYSPMLSSPCDRNLHLLLCSAFVPPCDRGEVLPPCRTFCQTARDNCLASFLEEDLSWPEELDCSSLPDNSDECFSSTSLATLPPLLETNSPLPISTSSPRIVTTKGSVTEEDDTTAVSTDTQDTVEPTREDTSRRGHIRCEDDASPDGYCMNGGTCFQVTLDGTPEQQCICHGNFTGKRCEEKVLTKSERSRLEKAEKRRNLAIGIGIAIACLVVLAIIIVLIIICRKHVTHKTHYFSGRPDSAVFTNPAYDDVTMTRNEADSFKQINADDSINPDESKTSNFYNEPYQEESNEVAENKFAESDEVHDPVPYCEPVEPSSPTSDSGKVKGQSPVALDNPSYDSFHFPSQEDTVIDRIKTDKF